MLLGGGKGFCAQAPKATQVMNAARVGFILPLSVGVASRFDAPDTSRKTQNTRFGARCLGQQRAQISCLRRAPKRRAGSASCARLNGDLRPAIARRLISNASISVRL